MHEKTKEDESNQEDGYRGWRTEETAVGADEKDLCAVAGWEISELFNAREGIRGRAENGEEGSGFHARPHGAHDSQSLRNCWKMNFTR